MGYRYIKNQGTCFADSISNSSSGNYSNSKLIVLAIGPWRSMI